MNVKLFGHRCLVEFHRPKSASKIVIPDAAQQHDSHRTGIVRFIGDGRPGKNMPKDKPPTPSLVKEGDVVMFQINQIMQATQAFVIDGKHYMNLLQDDLVARFTGEDVGVDNMEMLGDYVLLQHFFRQQPGSTLFLPETAMKASAPDFVYFRCLKKGTTTEDALFKVGDELVVNFGRLTPMFIIRRKEDGTSENQEFAYTRTEWVDGVVEEAGDAPVQSHPA